MLKHYYELKFWNQKKELESHLILSFLIFFFSNFWGRKQNDLQKKQFWYAKSFLRLV